jgi:hypothetical protein
MSCRWRRHHKVRTRTSDSLFPAAPAHSSGRLATSLTGAARAPCPRAVHQRQVKQSSRELFAMAKNLPPPARWMPQGQLWLPWGPFGDSRRWPERPRRSVPGGPGAPVFPPDEGRLRGARARSEGRRPDRGTARTRCRCERLLSGRSCDGANIMIRASQACLSGFLSCQISQRSVTSPSVIYQMIFTLCPPSHPPTTGRLPSGRSWGAVGRVSMKYISSLTSRT